MKCISTVMCCVIITMLSFLFACSSDSQYALGKATGWICQYAEWEEYWDTEEEEYTQYELQNDGYGYIEVDADSYHWVVKENVQIYKYDDGLSYYRHWWDVVDPGDFWKFYFPGLDVVLPKQGDPDVTRTHWWFLWNVTHDGVCASDAMIFHYADRYFEYQDGWD